MAASSIRQVHWVISVTFVEPAMASPKARSSWARTCGGPEASGRKRAGTGSTWAIGVGEIVGAGELLRHDHAPGVDHELARLRRVEGGKVGLHPVEPHVRGPRQVE